MLNEEFDIDERTASLMKAQFPQFAGMTTEQIQEFVTRTSSREQKEWEAEHQKKLAREKMEDEWVLKDEKQPKVDPKMKVVAEDCIRIAPDQLQNGFITKKDVHDGEEFVKLSANGKKVFVSKSVVSRALAARPFPYCSRWW